MGGDGLRLRALLRLEPGPPGTRPDSHQNISRVGNTGGDLGHSSLTASVHLTAVETVMYHDTVIVDRTAPTVRDRMPTEVVDRIDVFSVHLPCHPRIVFIVHADVNGVKDKNVRALFVTKDIE